MTTSYDFDRLIDRTDTGSIKWDKYPGRDVLPMWVADSDFAVVPEIREALQRRAEHPVYGYTAVSERLIGLIVERVGNRYGWDIDGRWIVPLPNVITSFYLACRACGKAGDPVYVPAVIYPPVAIAPGYYSMTSEPIPMTMRDERMIIDFDWLERQPPGSAPLMIFCNPQNPGGTVYRRDELQRLAEIAVRQELIVLSDEVHCDLLLDEDRPHIPIASLNPGIAERSITLISPSKTFNIAGLGCAFAIVPDRKLRARLKTNPYIVPHVNLMGLAAAEAAYRFGDEWNLQQCAYLAASRDYLIEEINRVPGLRLGPIEATYLAWIEVSALGLDNPPRFFEDAGVGMSPGRDFGDPGFMRLNFGCPKSRVELAVERIRKAVESLG
jgi:cystathionine beta-lyase